MPQARRAALRWIVDPESGEKLDSGLVLWLPGPQSFTGEDSAEFHIHGSKAAIAAVLGALGRRAGLRPAEPGEFSMRAFRNGRLDLFEAEALGDLISAETESQRRLALRLALGGAGEALESWRADVIRMLAHAEAAIDFSEEDDAVADAHSAIHGRALSLSATLAEAIARSDGARLVRDGVRVVIAGPPNAGKSRLLNRIAARDAAIVSPRPGTTRDVIELRLELGGLPVLLSDTAGLHAGTGDEIEAIGMDRARAAMDEAQIILWVTAPDAEDGNIPPLAREGSPPPPGGGGFSGSPPGRAKLIRVRNKSDLADPESRLIRNDSGEVHVSAETGAGVAVLLDLITEAAQEMADVGNTVVFSRERQLSAARAALIHLRNVTVSHALPMESVAEELRAAAFQIGRISGRVDVEDLLDAIFRDFCIGK